MHPGNLGRAGLILGLVVAAAPGGAGNGGLPPPVDPGVAIRGEFAGARSEGTSAALILFIARNPGSVEAEEARELLAGRRSLDPLPYPGPDGAVMEAFDRARLAGPSALADFAATYRESHPLGAEALNAAWTRRGL